MLSKEELIKRLDRLLKSLRETGLSEEQKKRAIQAENDHSNPVQLDDDELEEYFDRSETKKLIG